MAFDPVLAQQIAWHYCNDQDDEKGLVGSFVQVCHFLYDHPDRLSGRSRNSNLSVQEQEGLHMLAERYYAAYRRSDVPKIPTTIPDEMISTVLREAFGYSEQDIHRIKTEHQHAMAAENCVGALLERYLDSVLRPFGWNWCCGDFVRAIDFVRKDDQGNWIALQVKNRDNSENSSSSSIRSGTTIQKWFRSFSKSNRQNWDHLPSLMQHVGLSEAGFADYVRSYLSSQRTTDHNPT